MAAVTICSDFGALSYSFLNPEPVSCSIQGSYCCFLTHIQFSQETGKMIWYSFLSRSLPQFIMIHTVKGFNIVSETEIDVFLKSPCFLYNPVSVGNLISSSSSFSKPSLDIWNFLVHVRLKPNLTCKILSMNLTGLPLWLSW